MIDSSCAIPKIEYTGAWIAPVDRIVKSDQYGSYVSHYLGWIDTHHMYRNAKSDDIFNWHPVNLYVGHSVVCSPRDDAYKPTHDNHRYLHVWVTRRCDNKLWHKQNKDCRYMQLCPDARFLPVSLTDKQFKKYIDKYGYLFGKLLD